jgi:uncharacterized membrane protein
MEYTTGQIRPSQIRPMEVYKEAWALMKPRFILVWVTVIIGMVLSSTIILMGPIMVGVFMCLLDVVDGNAASLEKLFKGFSRWKAGVVIAAFAMIPVLIFVALAFVSYVPAVMASLGGEVIPPEQLLSMVLGVLAIELVVGVVMTIIHTLMIFSFPLIADHTVSGIAALKLSTRAVWANKKGVGGFFGIGILVAIAGYMLFCIGIYIAVPVIMMATTVAYRKVFPQTTVPEI